MYCTRTGRPDRLRQHRRIERRVAAVVAAIGAGTGDPDRRAPCRPAGPGSRRRRRARNAASTCRSRTSRCRRCTSPTAQAGPMLECDWNGHSYSASTTRAAPAKAASTSPVRAPAPRACAPARCGCGRRDRHIRETAARLRPGDLERLRRADRVPFLLRDDAQETLASRPPATPGMPAIELSSTATGMAPATGGRIMRPCSMPGTLTSTT